ncbi:DUF1080 domain-containing protein [Sphingomonas populi]|uniref:DUF1080 domain-containing protein n=1 Tax=Sphingomonas populi TaxID=2484750 RepID=A0A4Q6Y1M0_9SPHN|nr:DUF1080 domain-containing protein [Sphingomonas populi]RZF63169.1 DUF1080 domain-containing protein [Sphingomonas populi]
MDRRRFIGSSVAAAFGCSLPGRLLGIESDKGWQRLFDSDASRGWTFFQEGVGNSDLHNAVTVRDGVIHFLGSHYTGTDAAPGHISTKKSWGNYHLRLEYRYGLDRWPPRKLQRRNSGILYHMGPETDRLFPNCVEFQLEEGDVGDAIMVDTLALMGPSLGGTPLWPNWIPAFPSTYQEPIVSGGIQRQWHKHAGEYERMDDWNTVDLYAFNDQAAHLVNGRIVTTLFKLATRDKNGRTTPLTAGRIALELEWAEIMFRNVMIRPLDAVAVASILKRGSD